jgi:hypothetical protein
MGGEEWMEGGWIGYDGWAFFLFTSFFISFFLSAKEKINQSNPIVI